VTAAFALTLCAHAALAVLVGVQHQRFPFASVPEALLVCSLAISLLYLGTQVVTRESGYGAFVFPVNFILAVGAILSLGSGEPLPHALMSHYFVVHVVLTVLSYACFFMSFVVSVMYLVQHRLIKGRKLGFLYQRLPALASMDELVTRVDALGVGLLLLGMAMGFVWLEVAIGSAVRLNAKIALTMVTAGVYSAEHILRVGRGWRGQRPCIVSLLGFILVLITLAAGRHGY
jgi:HemX protein